MTIFDLYKHITDSTFNSVVFLAFIVTIFFTTCIFISFVTDQIIRIVAAVRTPFVPPAINAKKLLTENDESK